MTAFSCFLGSLNATQLLGDDRMRSRILIDRAFEKTLAGVFSKSNDINAMIGVLGIAFEKALNGHRPIIQAISGDLSQCFLGEKPIPFIVALALEATQLLSDLGEDKAALKLLALSEPLAEKYCTNSVHAGFAFLRGRISDQLDNQQQAEDYYSVALTKTNFYNSTLGGFIPLGQAIDEIKTFCLDKGVWRTSKLYRRLSVLLRDIEMSSAT